MRQDSTDDSTPDDPLARALPARLYHYTSPAGLLGIVTSDSLWVSDARYLNDVRELKQAGTVINHVLRKKKRAKLDHMDLYALLSIDSFGRNWRPLLRANIASLSEERDLLSQWRAYCRSGGFAVGFATRNLRRALSKQGYTLAPCIYDAKKQREIIDMCVEVALSANRTCIGAGYSVDGSGEQASVVFAALAASYAPLFKHPSFSEEREWRVIPRPHIRRVTSSWWKKALANADVLARIDAPALPESKVEFREGRSVLIPYHPLALSLDGNGPINQIVVGPSNEMDLSVESARHFLKRHGLSGARVLRSRCSYRPD